MNYALSDRAKIAEPNLMREIDKFAEIIPGFISLADGNPAYESFPLDELRKLSDDTYANDQKEIFLYGSTGGSEALCSKIAERLERVKNIKADGNKVLVTGGAQGVLFIMPMVFVNQGDRVIFEEFSYSNALTAVRLFGGEPVGVKSEPDGIDTEALEEALKNTERVKYIYIQPNFSNPTGRTLSLEKRKKVYELACKYDVLILEDDAYGDLRYEGEFLPCIKSFDTDGRVVYTSTFSKTIAAGMRVGFCTAAPEVIDRIYACKSANDSGTNMAAQLVVLKYMERYDFEQHIVDTRKIYDNKRQVMKKALDKYVHPACTVEVPSGGMFCWVTVPDYVNEKDMFDSLIENKIGVVPSYVFSSDRSIPGKSFRICFSFESAENIEEGCKRFGEVTHNYCK